jgi:hypothetical protein
MSYQQSYQSGYSTPAPVYEVAQPLVQNDQAEYERAILLLIVGIFVFPVLLPYNWFATRQQSPRVKMLGNVSCGIFVTVLVLSALAIIIPIIVVVAIGASAKK